MDVDEGKGREEGRLRWCELPSRPQNVRVRFAGSRALVERAVAAYFRRYNPAGYNTMIVSSTPDPNAEEIEVVIERLASCD
jgi:hypothetical protein